jgi:hypothetical protein
MIKGREQKTEEWVVYLHGIEVRRVRGKDRAASCPKASPVYSTEPVFFSVFCLLSSVFCPLV